MALTITVGIRRGEGGVGKEAYKVEMINGSKVKMVMGEAGDEGRAAKVR